MKIHILHHEAFRQRFCISLLSSYCNRVFTVELHAYDTLLSQRLAGAFGSFGIKTILMVNQY